MHQIVGASDVDQRPEIGVALWLQAEAVETLPRRGANVDEPFGGGGAVCNAVRASQVQGRSEQWQVSRAANGELLAQVSNTGNVHLKVSELRLQGENGASLAQLPQKGGNSVIFPGEQRVFRLPAVAQATQIQVQTDQGLQMVALNDGGGAVKP